MDERDDWWNRLQRTSMLLATLTTASAVAGAGVWLLVTLWLAKTAVFDQGEYMVEIGLIVGVAAWVAAAVWTVPHLVWAARAGDDLARPDLVTARGMACVGAVGVALVVLVLPSTSSWLGYLLLVVLVAEVVLGVQRRVLLRSRPGLPLRSYR